MKILNFEEFIKMPEGTIFSEYEPCIVGGLWRKGENLPEHDGIISDFWKTPILAECCNGNHPEVTDCQERWATYDYDEQFAVYEDEDLNAMRELIFR